MTASPRVRAQAALVQHLHEQTWSGQSASRRHILEAFLELATTHGITSVTMRMIARSVNIKAPSLYAHFPDGRDEIVAESLRWHFHKFGTALVAAIDGIESADDYWDAMVRLHFTRQVSLPESNLWDLLVATDRMVHVLPSDLRIEVNAWVDLYERMYLTTAEEMGFADAQESIGVVMTLLEGSTRWAGGAVGDEALATLSDRAVTLSRAILTVGARAA